MFDVKAAAHCDFVSVQHSFGSDVWRWITLPSIVLPLKAPISGFTARLFYFLSVRIKEPAQHLVTQVFTSFMSLTWTFNFFKRKTSVGLQDYFSHSILVCCSARTLYLKGKNFPFFLISKHFPYIFADYFCHFVMRKARCISSFNRSRNEKWSFAMSLLELG